MITIAVAIAAAINVSLSGTSSSMLQPAPLVSMTQTGNSILIVAIQNGPLSMDSIIINVEDDLGHVDTDPTMPSGNVLSGGETIGLPGLTTPGKYTVSMIYANSIVGMTEFSVK